MYVERPKLSWKENIYLPTVIAGLMITLKHFRRTLGLLLFGQKKEVPKERKQVQLNPTGLVTMQYPEEKWEMPEGYRGAPTLVKDEEEREKCVSCQLCEFVCPPRAIRITPGSIPFDSPFAHVEKAPREFQIDMLRCIYCGLCEEVCPEEAIFLNKDVYFLVGEGRGEMVHDKKKLYELGGVKPRPVKKWANK